MATYTIISETAPGTSGAGEHLYEPPKRIDAANEAEAKQKTIWEADRLVSAGAAWVNVKLVDGVTGVGIYEVQRP
jgi:hypothetical protein